MPKVHGEDHHKAKLTEDLVLYIRQCDVSCKQLARKLGMSASTSDRSGASFTGRTLGKARPPRR